LCPCFEEEIIASLRSSGQIYQVKFVFTEQQTVRRDSQHGEEKV